MTQQRGICACGLMYATMGAVHGVLQAMLRGEPMTFLSYEIVKGKALAAAIWWRYKLGMKVTGMTDFERKQAWRFTCKAIRGEKVSK